MPTIQGPHLRISGSADSRRDYERLLDRSVLSGSRIGTCGLAAQQTLLFLEALGHSKEPRRGAIQGVPRGDDGLC